MKKVIFAGILLSLMSCQNDDAGPVDENTDPVAIEFEEIAQADMMGGEGFEASEYVIQNDAEWEDFLEQINSVNDYSSEFTETEINFSEYTVIAVIDQLRESDSYVIGIVSIMDGGSHILADYEITVPQGNVATVETQPFHIVKIPKTTSHVMFE